MLPHSLLVACTLVWGVLALLIDLDLSKDELAFLKDDPEVTHKLTFGVSRKTQAGTSEVGEFALALFGSTVPKTVENFVMLSTGEKGFGYANSIFHRIIKGFMIQGGDFERKDGTGGHSIYDGGKFDDENFQLKHNKKGRLSMANAGRNTNGAQFFILTGDGAPHLDGMHVVFGQLVLGFDVLDQLNNADTGTNDRPTDEWSINLHGIQLLNKGKVQSELVVDGDLDELAAEDAIRNDGKAVAKVPDSLKKGLPAATKDPAEEADGDATKAQKIATTDLKPELSTTRVFGILAVFSFLGYYGLRWTRRRRLGITITGFRS